MILGIVDYDIGNLRSVQKAFSHVGGGEVDVRFVRTPGEIDQAHALVLPGVGAFGDCVQSLARSGMWESVVHWAQSDRPLFGICVGYQMLFASSEEAPGQRGLGIFQGGVKKFSPKAGLKVPQIGWNTIEVVGPQSPFLADVKTGDFVYYVHSYFVAPAQASIVALQTTYGETFASAIVRGNLIATQFHPEKSQKTGLQLIRNFISRSRELNRNTLGTGSNCHQTIRACPQVVPDGQR